jgi:hypothetical protein
MALLFTHLIAFQFVEVVFTNVKREEEVGLCGVGHLVRVQVNE